MHTCMPEVSEVEVIGPHSLRVTFDNGVVRDIDFTHALTTILSQGCSFP
jgi:hypothetical protein